jgi:hypothetical protein
MKQYVMTLNPYRQALQAEGDKLAVLKPRRAATGVGNQMIGVAALIGERVESSRRAAGFESHDGIRGQS